jgi:hypothetical protein
VADRAHGAHLRFARHHTDGRGIGAVSMRQTVMEYALAYAA